MKKSLTKQIKTLGLVAIALGSATAINAVSAADITVGSKNFTEQLLISEMTSQLLEKNGYKVKRAEGMGSSVVRAALENGQVDVYWEYTGTSLVTYNKIEDKLSPEETYNKVKELDAKVGIVWLDASKANNTYALAVRSEEQNLKTISDLAKVFRDGKKIKLGVNAEWPKRPDGLIGLQEVYDFKAPRASLANMDSGLIYDALRNGDVDIGLVFATDGRIAAFNFKVLEDNKGFFPNYALTPNIRQETLSANPKIGELLNALSAKLDDDTMQRLNGRVAVDKIEIPKVATEFLQSIGML